MATIIIFISIILSNSALRLPTYSLHSRNTRKSRLSVAKADLFGDIDMEKEEIERLRIEKIIENDRWQSCNFRDFQGGEWAGVYEVYDIRKSTISKVSASYGDFIFNKIESGNVFSESQASPYKYAGVNITFTEVYDPDSESYINSDSLTLIDGFSDSLSRLTRSTRKICESTEFRPSRGNQIVGGAFTVCDMHTLSKSSESNLPDIYVSEVAIKEDFLRTRVRYLYRKIDKNEVNALNNEEIQSQAYDMALAGFIILRERFIGDRMSLALPDFDPTRGGRVGRGIYDPQESGEPYVELTFPGLLTLLFPRGLKNGLRAVLTMEWWGENMRYQVDRKLQSISKQGEIKSLELTEVRIEDSEKYPALFPPSPELLK